MADLIPIETAAARVGISPARLRGLVLRNNLTDPIGDLAQVYDDWRLRRIAEDFSAVPSDEAEVVQE